MASASTCGRQQLRLCTDALFYNGHRSSHSEAESPDPFSPDIDRNHVMTPEPSSVISSTLCSVLCMYDFQSDDPDHLSFFKHEILDIVKMEESGWWAAIRSEGDEIGWIPQAFVNTLSDEMAERLRNTRQELRGYEFNAEQLYSSAPIVPPYEHIPDDQDSPHVGKQFDERDGRAAPFSSSRTSHDSSSNMTFCSDSSTHPLMSRYHQPPSCDFSPNTLTLHHSSNNDESLAFQTSSSDSEDIPQMRSRAGTVPTRTSKRTSSGRLRTLHEAQSFSALSRSPTPDGARQRWLPRTEADVHQPSVQCSIKAEELGLDSDGQVIYGTVDKLLEKLTSDNSNLDPKKIEKHTMFRNAFLMTFRTFMTPEMLFKRLVAIYRNQPPDELSDLEVEEWGMQHNVTQRCVLMVFKMWLEDYRLLDEEPHIAKELTEFLRCILSPPLASIARLLTKSIQRLTFITPTILTNTSPIATPRKTKKSKGNKNDLCKFDPVDIAEQITLYEFQKYNKVTPQECLRHATGKQSQSGLTAFCSTHDKLVFWVKVSVLETDALGKRADTVDFWIKVAEKCRNLNNFASMSAIITGLSSTVISRLHLTWAHTCRKTPFENLSRYNDPVGNFAGYRSLMRDVDGSCIPFVIVYLTDLVHIQDQYPDEDGGRLCFFKRQRWYEVVTTILRYQSRPYDITENELTMGFITKHLRDLEEGWKDHNWFWSKSQEVQQIEMAHADIRKGLEAAGF